VTTSDPQSGMFALFIPDSESTEKMDSSTKKNYVITDWHQKIGSTEPPYAWPQSVTEKMFKNLTLWGHALYHNLIIR